MKKLLGLSVLVLALGLASPVFSFGPPFVPSITRRSPVVDATDEAARAG